MDATWYFDFISPFAYLQFARIRSLAAEAAIRPCPIVFAALLGHHGQLGPAEIDGKRECTYRMVQWTADASGVELQFPPAHPFNPISALRLAVACGSSWEAIACIFDHVWRHGRAADSPASLGAVAHTLGIADVESAVASVEVKQQLRANTDEAIAHGVFGVPTLRLAGQLFWGNDSTPLIEAAMNEPGIFKRGKYARVATLPRAVVRVR